MIGALRAVFGFALTMLIPGYAFMLAVYPRRGDFRAAERLALSSVLSIAITVFMALFLDMFLGLDYTGENMTYALVSFTLVCLGVWLVRARGRT